MNHIRLQQAIILESINFLKSLSLPNNFFPMFLMPFLSEPQLKELEREGIGGIDLCGNCVVVYSGTFSVFPCNNSPAKFPGEPLE